MQQRGQVTLPKKYRDNLGLIDGGHVVTKMEGKKIIMEALENDFNKKYVRKAKISRKEYIKAVRRMSEYIQKNGPLWTDEDDKVREESLRKEKEKRKKLDW